MIKIAQLLIATFILVIGACAQDKDVPLGTLIQAGNYKYVAPGITAENFKFSADDVTDVTRMELLTFEEESSTRDIVNFMVNARVRPARLRELLLYDAAHPEVHKVHPILAIGSVMVSQDGFHLSPMIGISHETQELVLNVGIPDNSHCGNHCRFLAVRW